MTENEEQAYISGSRMAYLLMLQECRKQLGYDDQASKDTRWLVEREQSIGALKMLCDEFGIQVEWDEQLHLADVIEKHLVRALREMLP